MLDNRHILPSFRILPKPANACKLSQIMVIVTKYSSSSSSPPAWLWFKFKIKFKVCRLGNI